MIENIFLLVGLILGYFAAWFLTMDERKATLKLFETMQAQLKDHHEMTKLRLGYKPAKETKVTPTDASITKIVTNEGDSSEIGEVRTTASPNKISHMPPSLNDLRQGAIQREALDAQKRRKDVQMVKDMPP